MKKLMRRLIPVLCLVAITGCGTTDATSTAADDTGPTTSGSTPTNATTPHRPAITSVSYRRGGGLKPTTVTRIFTADGTPPDGFTAADVDQVLDAAQTFAESQEVVKPLPANVCCDRYIYNVTISWSDGTTKTFASVDGQRQPKAFESLLSQLA